MCKEEILKSGIAPMGAISALRLNLYKTLNKSRIYIIR